MTAIIKNKAKTPNCNVEMKLVQRSRMLEEYTVTDLENLYSWVKEIFLQNLKEKVWGASNMSLGVTVHPYVATLKLIEQQINQNLWFMQYPLQI
jgi:hypothetical protein